MNSESKKLGYNLITDTDSYKFSHWNQYPSGLSQMMSYFESRGGPFSECTLFGLQYLLDQYLTEPITMDHVREAKEFSAAHGEPFNEAGWTHVVAKYGGHLPVRIRAIPEGLVVPTLSPLITVEGVDDPACPWIVNWIETMLVRLWYPSTIATTSRESKKILRQFLDMTSDDPEGEIGFKLHDFGARGVATLEQSRLGSAAHLLSFLGSDSVEGIRCANHYYHCDMAGYSIPATEHSTMTAWGEEGELDAMENYVRKYLLEREVPDGTPRMAACVSDSYDVFRAVRDYWCGDRLLPLIKKSGGTLVIRPDSGDPVEILTEVFRILEEKVGMTLNSKGYKVLPPYFRVIQGDGIDSESMHDILQQLTDLKISASNIAFGSGGGLLQKVDRDTQKFAFKCCHALVNGHSVDVRKNPVTDPGKQSKGGRLDLVNSGGEFKTVVLDKDEVAHPDSVMQTVYEMGEVKERTTFEECRNRMNTAVA